MFHRVVKETAPQNEQETVTEERPQAAKPAPAPAAQDSPRSEPKNEPKAAEQPKKSPNPTREQATTKKEDTKPMTEQQTQAKTTDTSAPRLDIPGGAAYQRPGQAPVRAGGSFPAAYPGYNAPMGAVGRDLSQNESRLIIGRGITMSGEIESCNHLVVEGTVEATLKGASVLDIAESGVFYGTVEIAEATVAGRFEGDIQVNGRLTVRSSGVISGTITYKELEVEAGATLEGRIAPFGSANAAKGSAPRKQRPQKDGQDAANSDDGLFAKQAAAE